MSSNHIMNNKPNFNAKSNRNWSDERRNELHSPYGTSNKYNNKDKKQDNSSRAYNIDADEECGEHEAESNSVQCETFHSSVVNNSKLTRVIVM